MYLFSKLFLKNTNPITYKLKDNYVEIIRDTCNNLVISKIVYIYV